jgi:hypothetical protein
LLSYNKLHKNKKALKTMSTEAPGQSPSTPNREPLEGVSALGWREHALTALALSTVITGAHNLDNIPEGFTFAGHVAEEVIDVLDGNPGENDVDLSARIDWESPLHLPALRLESEKSPHSGINLSEEQNREIAEGDDIPGLEIDPGREYKPGESGLPGETTGGAGFIEVKTTKEVNVREQESTKVDMEWARQFVEDNDADKLTDVDQLDAIDNAMRTIIAEGKQILFIETIGHASDEDNTPDTRPEFGPGFGIDNAQNVELATFRGAVVRELVQQRYDQLAQETGQGPLEVQNRTGIEVQDEKEQAAIESYASSKGLDNFDLNDIVKTWNRGGDVDPGIAEILEDVKADRFVMVRITTLDKQTITETSRVSSGEKDVSQGVDAGPNDVIVGPKEIVPGQEGNDTEIDTIIVDEESKNSEKQEGKLDILILALPLLALKLRKREKGSPTNPFIAPPVVGPPLPLVGDPPLPPPPIPGKLREIYRAPKKIGTDLDAYGKTPNRIKQPRPQNFSKNRKSDGQGRNRGGRQQRTSR